MSKDNGDKIEQEYPQLIFKAEVVMLPNGKKDIQFTCKSSHIPTLDNISKELDYHIIELRAMKKTKDEMEKKGIIQKATTATLNNLLRRGHKR